MLVSQLTQTLPFRSQGSEFVRFASAGKDMISKMETVFLALIAIVAFSAFQSVAGVGLLLFGTPTLVLLGFSFSDTLALVIPTSLVISAFQLWGGWNDALRIAPRFALQTAPALALGLLAVFLLGLDVRIHWLLVAGLATAVILQISSLSRRSVFKISNRADWLILPIVGLIHGLTNLGGGFLASYASIRGGDRAAIRAFIAMGYTVFGTAQIILLILLSPESFSPLTLFSMFLGGMVYLTLGRRLFSATSEKGFKILMPIVTSLFLLSLVVSAINMS